MGETLHFPLPGMIKEGEVNVGKFGTELNYVILNKQITLGNAASFTVICECSHFDHLIILLRTLWKQKYFGNLCEDKKCVIIS